jgi:hypothetical protein
VSVSLAFEGKQKSAGYLAGLEVSVLPEAFPIKANDELETGQFQSRGLRVSAQIIAAQASQIWSHRSRHSAALAQPESSNCFVALRP